MTCSRRFVFFFLFWLAGSLLFIKNSGGYGLSLPQNCFSWAMMGILIFTVSLSLLRKKQAWIITPALRWFAAGIVILALPLLYTRPEWLFNGGLYWAGAVVGLLFYFSCVQLKLSRTGVYSLLSIWLLACMAHALLILLQLTPAGEWIAWPVVNGRPYGVFQQVNLLATFLACGIGLALFLFLVPENLKNRRKQCFAAFALFIFPCVLMLIQSRIGLLSAVITIVMMLSLMGAVREKYQSVILLLCGTAAGWWVRNHTLIGDISHSDSDGARLEMIGTAWEMLKQRPWSGWGFGGFEYTFQFFRVLQGKSTEGTGVVIHPHNEFLFWGVEAGAVALGGLLLIIIGGIKVVISTWHCYHNENNPLPLALCIIILPVLLHTQTEYPFGLSALHFAMCLLLLAQADKLSDDTSAENILLSRPAGSALSIIMTVISAVVILWMCSAFLLGLLLTDIERRGMQDIQPLASVPEIALVTQYERVEFDRSMNRLMRYNQTRDPKLLEYYRLWAEEYLDKHADKNVYFSLVMILHHQGNITDKQKYLSRARELFPQENKFVR